MNFTNNTSRQSEGTKKHLTLGRSFLILGALIYLILLPVPWYLIFPFTFHSNRLGIPASCVLPLTILPFAIYHFAQANQLGVRQTKKLLLVSWIAFGLVFFCALPFVIVYFFFC